MLFPIHLSSQKRLLEIKRQRGKGKLDKIRRAVETKRFIETQIQANRDRKEGERRISCLEVSDDESVRE